MKNLDIGNNIRRLRIKNGLTQRELANKIGVTWEMVSRYERGKSSPYSKIDAISTALNVSTYELLQNDYTSSMLKEPPYDFFVIPMLLSLPLDHNSLEQCILNSESNIVVQPNLRLKYKNKILFALRLNDKLVKSYIPEISKNGIGTFLLLNSSSYSMNPKDRILTDGYILKYHKDIERGEKAKALLLSVVTFF